MRHVLYVLPCVLVVIVLYKVIFHGRSTSPALFFDYSEVTDHTNINVDLKWYPPKSSWITDLDAVMNSNGTFDFRFDGNDPPAIGQYNYCNMEHINTLNYDIPDQDSFRLIYVELIHRHHKRTPYAANGFPVETELWDCHEEGLFYSAQSLVSNSRAAVDSYWEVYTPSSNPFQAAGFRGTCQFPQITKGGLEDSRQHGKDLGLVYRDILGYLPKLYDRKQVSFRVTNNVITSQVASQAIAGLYPQLEHSKVPLMIQPRRVDSLEPAYSCPTASRLSRTYGVGSKHPIWQAHLKAAQKLYRQLDSISSVAPSSLGFHKSIDHYFDNLSSRQCHGRRLPCQVNNHSNCVTQDMADTVYRIGQWEYYWLYRGSADTLKASIGSYGVWLAELAQNIRDAVTGKSKMKFRYNFAHDGSIARLLSILQVDTMVWPGMGAGLVFEVYSVRRESGKHVIRILWGGHVLKSSNPSLGDMDLIDLNIFLAYIDGLIGIGAPKVARFCTNK